MLDSGRDTAGATDFREADGLLQLTVPGEVVDFVSDLHLCTDMPHTLAAFLGYLQHTQADALVLLGDVFEAWVGDDSLSQRFEAQCVSALRQFSQRHSLFIMRGNRDFLLGPDFFAACGAVELPDPCVVATGWGSTLLTHGDAWCLADTAYQQFRQQVRQPSWQIAFLAKPLQDRLALAQHMRSASKMHQQDPNLSHVDVDLGFATQYLQAYGCSCLVHGHTHQPTSQEFGSGLVRHVLSDWDLDHPQVPSRAEVLRWSAEGWRRLKPSEC